MRDITVAAVQVAPAIGPLTQASIKTNTVRAVAATTECVAATGAGLVVLPESVTSGFTTGVDAADLWELTNRARAYDNHVYLIGANVTGTDPGGAIYFGNSMIVTPIAEVVARAASHECWISARLEPAKALASLTPGSSVPQPFDHLADRNLALIRRHADALLGATATGFECREHSGS